MKKIKNIKQLQFEKKRMRQNQEELEKKIRSSWSELKETVTPSSLAKAALNKIIKDKTEENINSRGILKNVFTYGISLLAKRFADKTGEKLDTIFKK